MKKAKNSKEYDLMLFECIEKELGTSASKKERPSKKKESKVLNEKR